MYVNMHIFHADDFYGLIGIYDIRDYFMWSFVHLLHAFIVSV